VGEINHLIPNPLPTKTTYDDQSHNLLFNLRFRNICAEKQGEIGGDPQSRFQSCIAPTVTFVFSDKTDQLVAVGILSERLHRSG
jgi:hypothetical protein